jgi:predicted GIY-YIG superfamily endonuclease
MSGRVVYTFHFWPPLKHAKHYTGSTYRSRLAERFVEHTLGRGAKITQAQRKQGGSWVVAQVEPGGYFRERQLKKHGAARRCEVCKAVEGYQSGQLSAEQALAQAGWNRVTPYERSLLLEIFGLPAEPQKAPEHTPPQIEQKPAPEPVSVTPEIEALVDALIESWSPKADAEAPTLGPAGPETGAGGPAGRAPSTDRRPGTFPGRGARPQPEHEIEATG